MAHYPKCTMPCRDVKQLAPAVQREFKKLQAAWIKAGLLHMAPCQTFRSGSYQHEQYLKGRKTPGPIVTNCDKGQSMHEYRVAIDYFNNVAGHEWDTDILRKAGKIAQDLGWIWGGDWDHDHKETDESFIDRPHIEWLGGLTHAQIRAGKLPK